MTTLDLISQLIERYPTHTIFLYDNKSGNRTICFLQGHFQQSEAREITVKESKHLLKEFLGIIPRIDNIRIDDIADQNGTSFNSTWGKPMLGIYLERFEL